MVVIGASAGGVEALQALVRGLPSDLAASVLIVLHIPAQSPSLLHTILGRASRLPVLQPADGQELEAGHIYVAPPDYHMLVEPGHIHLSKGPKENRHRPAI